jgi:predicted DNA-binding protein
MGEPMRITLDIPDEIHARLKALAKREGTTMRAIILRAIDRELAAGEPAQIIPPRFPVLESTRPGSLAIHNENIYDIIDFP